MSTVLRTADQLTLRSSDLVALAAGAYQQVLNLCNLYFTGKHGCYRVGLVGDAPLDEKHPLREQGYRFGYELAAQGIDLVIASATPGSATHAAAMGYNEATATGFNRAGRLICTMSERSQAVGEGGHIRYYPQGYQPFEFFSGFLSDLVSVGPGLDAYAANLELLQRAQLFEKVAKRVGIDKVPLGLRLRNSAILRGWDPRCICVGGHWSWLHKMRDTFLRCGTIAAGEGRYLESCTDIDALLNRVVERALEWEELTPQDCGGYNGKAVKIPLQTVTKKIRQHQSEYRRYMQLLGPRTHGHYRVAYFGSHSLQPDHPALARAYQLGYFLGHENIDQLEGNAGLLSIMGQAAAGHADGRAAGGTSARSFGVSLRLPWEAAMETASMRHQVFSQEALLPRIDTFLSHATCTVNDVGGYGTGVEDAVVIETARNVARKRPTGRLLSRCVQLGWRPTAYALGSPEFWAWRAELKQQLIEFKELDPANGEDVLMEFSPDLDDLKRRILDNRAQWRRFLRNRGHEPLN